MVKPWEVFYGETLFKWEYEIGTYFEDDSFPMVREYIRKAATGAFSAQSAYMHLHNLRRREGRGSALENAASLNNEAPTTAPVFAELNKVYNGDCFEVMRSMPNELADRIVTSPPYNLGKEYEEKRSQDIYVEEQMACIAEAVRLLHPKGSICWQVGNHVHKGEIFPLDIILYPIFKNHVCGRSFSFLDFLSGDSRH